MRIRYKIGLAGLALLILYGLLRSLAVSALSGKGMTICPHCGSRYINPSQTPEARDWLFRIVGWLAYRCKVCNHRFYRPRFST